MAKSKKPTIADPTNGAELDLPQPIVRQRRRPPRPESASEAVPPKSKETDIRGGAAATPLTGDTEPTYEVGYGKPPQHTKWKKGQSGNPRGRVTGSKNLRALYRKAREAKVTIIENGKRRQVPAIEATVMKTSIDAAAGKPKDRYWVLNVAERDLVDDTTASNNSDVREAKLPEQDREILEHYVRWKIAELTAGGQSDPVTAPASTGNLPNEAGGSKARRRRP